ncbi:MAG: class IV adenylate cyclase [Candidatus Neomarinimicrobiota bacterium]|jgi:predicted adenylyl cyclase CyaB
MAISIIEIKARCSNQDKIRRILKEENAIFKGKDHQIDTYFNVPNGRLKLREGAIENNLIHYERPNQKGPKRSSVLLYKSTPGSSLKAVLAQANGVVVIVDKIREIYFIDNIKFHIDSVKNLGTFIEIEAIDEEGEISPAQLKQQCQSYLKKFEVDEKDLVDCSYSDLLLKKIK